jgi:hypothetical protein
VGHLTAISPLTHSQAFTVARLANRGMIILMAGMAVIAGLLLLALAAVDVPVGELLRSAGLLMAIFLGVPWVLVWWTARRIVRQQQPVGWWAFDQTGAAIVNPLGTGSSPWVQIQRITVRGDVILLQAKGFGAAAAPLTNVSGADVEQILSWAAAAGVRVKS